MKNKLLNRFIGALDNRDEYQLQELHKELAFSGMILWILMMTLMFISFILDAIHNTVSFMTMALLTINMIYAFSVLIKTRKKGLDNTDCANITEYKNKKKYIKKNSILSGIIFTFLSLILSLYITPYLSTGEIDVNWFDTLRYAFSGFIFGLGVYFLAKSRLKKNF